jgi:hypothetical protein
MQYAWLQHIEIFTMWGPRDLQFWSVNTWRYIKPLVGLNKMYVSGTRTFKIWIKLLLDDVCEIRAQASVKYFI